MTKEIYLTQGKVALVDDDDYEWLSMWRWFADRGSNDTFYARRNEKGSNPKKVRMHREIVGAPGNMEVDHIDGDGLNNQKGNLRICEKIGNAKNRRLHKNNKSGYKGVCWHKQHKKWYSHIKANKKYIFLGLFDNLIDAARAYDQAAKIYHGEFAKLNLE
jgi:hypothetical protein